MGCDIHLYTEYEKDGNWLPGDWWVQSDRYNEGRLCWRVPLPARAFDSRDYDFFGFLADVRNGTWGQEMPVVSAPRGLPENISDRLRDESDGWGCDGHSHSYLTLAELDEAWKKFKGEKIRFNAFVGTESEEMKGWLALPEDERPAPNGYAAWSNHGVQAAWYQTVEECIGKSFYKLREYLNDLAWEHSLHDHARVRAVFWFDN